MNTRNFPFARNTVFLPVIVPCGLTPSKTAVDPLPKGVTSFAFINSYPIWVRVVGTRWNEPFIEAAEGQGWLLPPGFFGVFSTQSPQFMSGVAVARPGYPITKADGSALFPDAVVETIYGSGA